MQGWRVEVTKKKHTTSKVNLSQLDRCEREKEIEGKKVFLCGKLNFC